MGKRLDKYTAARATAQAKAAALRAEGERLMADAERFRRLMERARCASLAACNAAVDADREAAAWEEKIAAAHARGAR